MGETDISEEEVEKFIREYVTALEKLISGKFREVKSIGYEFGFPLEFPVSVRVYFGERGILIEYDKSDFFEITFSKDVRSRTKGRWGQFLLYAHFNYFKNIPYKKAESDVLELLNFPDKVEEHEKDVDRQYEAQLYEYMSFEVDSYLKYLDRSREVVSETKDIYLAYLHHLINIINNHMSRFEYIFRIRCRTLDQLYFMINADMETSLFLSLYGKYYAAISLLRKILEVNTRCIYLDYNVLRDNSFEEKIEKWLEGEKFDDSYEYIVNNILPPDIDRRRTQMLQKIISLNNSSLNQHIQELYKKLSVYVHLRPKPEGLEDLNILFSEYNENHFENFYSLFVQVVKISVILLFIKFPQILSITKYTDFNFLTEVQFQMLKDELL